MRPDHGAQKENLMSGRTWFGGMVAAVILVGASTVTQAQGQPVELPAPAVKVAPYVPVTVVVDLTAAKGMLLPPAPTAVHRAGSAAQAAFAAFWNTPSMMLYE